MLKASILLVFISLNVSLISQDISSDTLMHSPRKATLLSVAIPGAGQAYNKKYWKIPIIYGGFALSAYYLNRNLDRIDLYRGDLKAIQDDDPNTQPQTNFSPSNLNILLNRYKDLRDWSYVSIGAIYALQIIDANVDAHLHHFDVSDELSMSIMPYAGPQESVGLYVQLRF